MKNFLKETKMIVDSGVEVSCHGYVHTWRWEPDDRDTRARCNQEVRRIGYKTNGQETTWLTGSSIPTLGAYSENA